MAKLSNVQRLFGILEILRTETDAVHRLDAKEIAQRLCERYGEAIDPRSIRRAIDEMILCGCPVSDDGKYYYKGFFSKGEMAYLCNAARFGTGPSHNERETLIRKLCILQGSGASSAPRTDAGIGSPLFMENLGIVEDAMQAGRQITFHYGYFDVDGVLKLFERGNALKVYNAHPYGIVMANGRHYMIAKVNRHIQLSHYRIDRMADIHKRKGKIRPLERDIDLDQYVKAHAYMYSGVVNTYRLRVRRKNLNDVFDWFGQEITFENITGDAADVLVHSDKSSMQFWLQRYGKNATLIEEE